jgi:hypothetical protein
MLNRCREIEDPSIFLRAAILLNSIEIMNKLISFKNINITSDDVEYAKKYCNAAFVENLAKHIRAHAECPVNAKNTRTILKDAGFTHIDTKLITDMTDVELCKKLHDDYTTYMINSHDDKNCYVYFNKTCYTAQYIYMQVAQNKWNITSLQQFGLSYDSIQNIIINSLPLEAYTSFYDSVKYIFAYMNVL